MWNAHESGRKGLEWPRGCGGTERRTPSDSADSLPLPDTTHRAYRSQAHTQFVLLSYLKRTSGIWPVSISANAPVKVVVAEIEGVWLLGIEFRRVGRQKEQMQLPFEAVHVIPDWPAVVKASAVKDQKDRALRVVHEPLQELHEYGPVLPAAAVPNRQEGERRSRRLSGRRPPFHDERRFPSGFAAATSPDRKSTRLNSSHLGI